MKEAREEEENVTSSPSDSPEEHMLMPLKGQRCSRPFKRPLYSQEQEIEPKDICLEGGGQVWWMEFKWVTGGKHSSCQGDLPGAAFGAGRLCGWLECPPAKGAIPPDHLPEAPVLFPEVFHVVGSTLITIVSNFIMEKL